jgi:hypothetical protein
LVPKTTVASEHAMLELAYSAESSVLSILLTILRLYEVSSFYSPVEFILVFCCYYLVITNRSGGSGLTGCVKQKVVRRKESKLFPFIERFNVVQSQSLFGGNKG